MLYENINEDSLKSRVGEDWFPQFDCTELDKNEIDFRVKLKHESNSFDFEEDNLLWAESKQHPTDIYKMLAQLLLTIRKNAYNEMPPKFIGCFDCEKIAFIEYHYVLPVFALNDFNWAQTPSSVDVKTVKTVRDTIDGNKIHLFKFDEHNKELHDFIKANFNLNCGICPHSTLIDKNNFIFVFQKWLKQVKPKINIDWEKWKEKYGIYDRDFFLAELNIDDNGTTEVIDDKIVNRNFYITFHSTDDEPYHLVLKDVHEEFAKYSFGFKSNGLQQYTDFWKRYKRPPHNEFWNYIVNRLDLLVPQDVRERKGAYYTPLKWVELSQQYLADVLGENWQEEYYVWDCCAGTGNMEVGLKESYNVWASTIDQQDVDVMRDNIRKGAATLLDNHVFQFDFLNDDFNSEKVPADLKKVLADPEKRKKLVIYINPPYVEATTAATVAGTGENKSGVAISNKIYEKYKRLLGKASNEVFAQFFIRIYQEIPSAILAEFSKIKILVSPNFQDFRNVFLAKLEKMFLVQSKTFENVKRDFPIGFCIWNTGEKEKFCKVIADAYNADGTFLQHKELHVDDDNSLSINKWIKQYNAKDNVIGLLVSCAPDFQHNDQLAILSKQQERYCYNISANNIIYFVVYLSVRQCIKADWLNDRDQFLFPNDNWETDNEFITNCLIYTLFHGQNRITCTQGINHWIPYKEQEVGAKERFDSHFMSDFLAGKIKPEQSNDLFSEAPISFSKQITPIAQSVLDAGRELWRYYHEQPDANTNASLNDIRDYFKGKGKNGNRNQKSKDQQFTALDDNLKNALKKLATEVRPKVYEYGFLKK